ncbi:MAG TPA: AMP-binding protein, partial [Ktedonobacteraceae bacterium]|nr:AMP-binding protein [Ktedonobacteraceae bacterium]
MDNPENNPVNAGTAQTQPGQPTRPTHYLDGHALVRPDKPALICGDRVLTYAEFNTRAKRLANSLRELGVKDGERVAIMAHNSIEAVETAAATGKINGISLPINYRLVERELAYVLNDSESSVVVVGPDLISVVEGARPDVKGDLVYIGFGGDVPPGWLRYEELVERGSDVAPVSDDTVGSTMSYTSGTTGNPKGAYRPKGVPAPDVLQAVMAFGLSEADVHLLAGPYYHSAPNFFASMHLLLGSTLVIMPKFDAVEALRLIEKYHVTTTFVAPTLLLRMCDVPDEVAKQYDTHSLRTVILGGAPCAHAVKVRATERFGQVLWEFYGATET